VGIEKLRKFLEGLELAERLVAILSKLERKRIPS